LVTKELVVASRKRTVSRFHFHLGIFDQNMTVVPAALCLCPRLKIKLKDTIEVIEAESQAVLNTFTEQDF
jgi:hypothetical protein